ncbi:23S rRNA (guanosine(2251)-2'-O)-methyltransferase RlmB [Legionella israelensis]|uniref:23S rRNA (guanosine(2251)-2'-O)-methyltransferase RlmB n=1 Tax=Legionella israelensis TaxID=454 RepID=UPI00117EC5B6|nr:23S rRNA (guanosine(2251)-2'-O)-methyltransferase RlmB [Legionella israelensis]QDP71598.1 23S rRNA (guanosine(2251)-2'-O)-methyltransferase RlmB [Legionella israelensis]
MTEQYVYGLHAVSALLKNERRNIKQLFVNKGRSDERIHQILDLALSKHIPVIKLDAKQMQQQFFSFPHQGIIASVTPLPAFSEHDLLSLLKKAGKPALILILDGITDPHNLGACLRTADAAGVDFVLIPKDKNVGLTAVVSKVACGAVENMPVVRVTNLARAMEMLKEQGIWIYGAAGEAQQSLYDMDCLSPMAVVMGAEGKGLRRLTREHCDGLFSLPMLGSVESLNVSVATGVSLYEIIRQRQKG